MPPIQPPAGAPRIALAAAAVAVVAAVLALVPATGAHGAATPDHPAGVPFLTMAHALAQGDYALACAQISSAALREHAPQIPTEAGRLRACAIAFHADEDSIDKKRFASTRIVQVRLKRGGARVTVQTTFADIEPRATGTAVVENGTWKVREAPAGAHVGSLRLYRIPSSSMLPTLHAGDWALSDEAAYRHARPRVGDVVFFHPPAGAERLNGCAERPPAGQACSRATRRDAQQTYVKRIVGVPGDRIAIRGGHVIRNGTRAVEPFATAACTSEYAGCDFPRTLTVSAYRYYVLGDDRGASEDSRFWGPVARRAIIGKLQRVIVRER